MNKTGFVLCLILGMMLSCKTKKVGADTKGGDPTELSEQCMMKHDPGPCRGAFTRYYYDQQTGRCMSFIYGGCQGQVPFETLEDCQAACEQ